MYTKAFSLLLIVGIFVMGCSGEVKPPACDVFVSGNRINVVINLPAEGMDYQNWHDLSSPGISATPSKVTIDAGGSSVEYQKTGNTYDISYTVIYEDGEIKDYNISIKGNVYGEVEHMCQK